MSFAEWQAEFMKALEKAGLHPHQAERYGPGGEFEADAEVLWNRRYSLDLAVMHEFLGPDDPTFRARLAREKAARA